MKMWRYILLLSVLCIPVLAQDELNIDDRPYNLPSPILSSEIWEELQTDYFSNEIEVTRLSVNATAFMREVAPDVEDCVGFLPSQPTYQIQWDRAAFDEILPVRFFATSAEDLIMVIHEPDGDWHCADDFETVTSPMIVIDSLRSGSYTIWVGSKTNTEIFTGRLYISIGDHTPFPAPRSCCDGLVFSNPASSDTKATITYTEVDPLKEEDGDSGVTVSTDIIYRGDSGTQFITELFVYDIRTDEQLTIEDFENRDEECVTSNHPCDAERLRRTTSRRDYSAGSRRGPVEFQIETLDIDNLGTEYYFEVAVAILDDNAQIIEIVDKVTIGLDN